MNYWKKQETQMNHTTKKPITIAVLVILFSASNLLALAPKPKPESPPELYRVLKAIDSDTIDILYHSKKERIRLLRIDTPERERGYFKAKKALKKLVDGWKLRTDFEVPGELERGGYGRILAYVWVDGVNVNVEIVRLGWSRFWTKYGEGKYADEFRAAERETKEAKRGLWKSKKKNK